MLRTLAVVTVRQGENQTSSLEPFSLTSSNELVNDTLGIVAVDFVSASVIYKFKKKKKVTYAKSPN